MQPRPEPERTCIGCRNRAPRRELIRMVRRPGGEVALDLQGRSAGRGAYVHRAENCLRRASKGASLGRALKAPLSAPEAARLMAELRMLLGENA
jgi:predicted RNA-binding protein YlxR (DUF448 family)